MGYKKLSILSVSSLVFLVACNSASFNAAVGHFEGFEVVQTGGIPSQTSVSADVRKLSSSSLEVRITTEPASAEIDFEVSSGQSSNVELSSKSGYITTPVTFSPSKGSCFTSANKDELCINGNEIQLALVASSSKFVLDKMTATALQKLETPQQYKIGDLVQRSMNQSFTTQAAFQSVVQAQLTAKQAEMNLLPHININSALNIASLSVTTMVRSIGDLVPFFLPNRWFGAIALKDQSAAEVDAFKIVQAGAMNIVNGLGLSVLRDEESLRKLQENEVMITQIRDEIVASEQESGNVPVGEEATINVLLDNIQTSISTLQEAISEEKTALSQAAGFNNPQAVAEVEPLTLPAITGPITGTLESWETEATSRSLQLMQANALIESAQKMKGEKEFEWLDPSGDDNGSIGFGFVDHIKIQEAQIQQLMVSKSTSQSQILEQVNNALTQSSNLFQTYQDDIQSSQQSQNSINLYLYKFQNGIAFDMTSLATVLGQKANSDVAQVNDFYAYSTLSAQLDFLTFSGVYAPLIGENP